jgi:hypothetical protein
MTDRSDRNESRHAPLRRPAEVAPAVTHLVEAERPMLMFAFRTDVPVREQNGLLDKIRDWPGVARVARLSPEATRPDLARFAYLYLSDDMSADRMISRLLGMPEVESAESPASRQLL